MGAPLSRLGRLALTALDYALSDLFQTRCLGCEGPTTKPLCGNCYWFPWLPEAPGAPVQSALSYRSPWRTVLHEIKFARHRELLRLFQPVVAQCDFDFVHEGAVVVPVPIHYSTLRARGFNQSEVLARWVAAQTGLPLALDSLSKTRATQAQSLLGARARATNLQSCFEWSGGKTPDAVLLVDDVFTTGATYDACRHVLQEVGVQGVQIWTVFRAKGPIKLKNSLPNTDQHYWETSYVEDEISRTKNKSDSPFSP
jgi:ComF family protein